MRDSRRGRLGAGWPLAAAIAFAAGCASLATPGDRYFEAGDFVPAAAAYEAILEGEETLGARERRALFRLALTCAIPQSPLRDPARAAELFRRLIDEHPQSAYAVEARFILEQQSAAANLEQSEAEAQARVLELSEELARRRDEAETKGAEIEELEQSIASLRRDIKRVQAELAQRETELQQLKQIDLE